jgi:hypothetical protein
LDLQELAETFVGACAVALAATSVEAYVVASAVEPAPSMAGAWILPFLVDQEGLGELLEERLRRVELERQSGLAYGHGGSLLAHLFALEVTLQGIEKQSVMGHTVPVEDLLLLLCADAVVLVKEVKERALGLFKRRICTRFQVAQIREDTLLELLRVLNGAAKGLESERKTSHDVGA